VPEHDLKQERPGPAPRGGFLLKSVLRVTLAALFGATLFLVIFEKRLIYYPSTQVDLTPMALGLPFEEVHIEVEPGVRIHGWFIKATKAPSVATILFSHGNAGNIADRLDRVQSWRDLGADFFLYDYRGFGRSSGSPDEEGTYRDGRAAYDHLVKVRGIDPARLVLMGESLGSAISIQLALDRRAAGLVLEAPFASIAHMATAIYPFLPVKFFVRTRYDNLAKIPRLQIPLLVTQGARPEVLANYYGIEGVNGPEFRSVDLTADQRGGVLSHGSVLAVSRYRTLTLDPDSDQEGAWRLDHVDSSIVR